MNKRCKLSLNKKKLVFSATKLIAISFVLCFGIPFIWNGYQLSQQKPPSEHLLRYEAEMCPKAGAPVGNVKIGFAPTEAFVIGDKVTADIEVEVNWLESNETASVHLIFIDCLATDVRWAWTNTSHYNGLVILEYNYSMATYSVYKAKAFLWFLREGIFGANITVYSPYSQQLLASFGTLDGTVRWSFPEMLSVKSYSYLEERKNTLFINAVTLEILGLTVIAISPIAVIAVSLLERLYESLTEKEKPIEGTPEKSETGKSRDNKLESMIKWVDTECEKCMQRPF